MRELIDDDGIRAVAVAGYSLGGNLTLKLAGELGDSFPAAQSRLRRVADDGPGGVREGAGTALEHRLRVQLRAPTESAHAAEGGVLSGRVLAGAARTRYGPSGSSTKRTPRRITGSVMPSDYYYRASAMRVIDRIRVPALILTAEDDPFVPVDPFRDPSVPTIRL